MNLMILILAVIGLTLASWSVIELVDNLRHDSRGGAAPRSHRPDSFDPDAQRRGQTAA